MVFGINFIVEPRAFTYPNKRKENNKGNKMSCLCNRWCRWKCATVFILTLMVSFIFLSFISSLPARPRLGSRGLLSNEQSIGSSKGDDRLNGISAWRERAQTWPYGSSRFKDQAQQLSHDIIIQEWKNISSEAIEPFTYTLPLNEYVLAKGGQPIRVMVVTTWRSGSTFLGDLLMAPQATFYHYEPLLPYGIKRFRDINSSETNEVIKGLHQLFSCNYTNMDLYLRTARNKPELLLHNHRLWKRGCGKARTGILRAICYNAEFLQNFCSLYPFQTMKTVRLRLKLVEEFLNDPLFGPRMKIILLVRDPRGTISSRHERLWCPGKPDCDSPERLCDDLESDYRTAMAFYKNYPDNFMVVRYEDMALSVLDYTEKILNFIGLGVNRRVNRFLTSHTSFDKGSVSSTFRNSKKTPFRWMQKLLFPEVKVIQNACSGAMDLWGYNVANDEEEYKNLKPLRVFTLDSNDTSKSTM